MSQNISLQQVTTANSFFDSDARLNNSEFNPVQQTSRVRLYACATVAGAAGRGGMVTFQLGPEVKCREFVVPVSANLSMRDHLVAEGIIGRGQKLSIQYRNEGTATPTINAAIVIEPI